MLSTLFVRLTVVIRDDSFSRSLKGTKSAAPLRGLVARGKRSKTTRQLPTESVPKA